MSKLSHDSAVAELRQQMSTLNKPWYRSCSKVIEQHDLSGGRCLDLCSGNNEYARILRDRYNMEVVCADYVPFHLEHAEKEGFATIALDLDGEDCDIDKVIEKHIASFDLVVSLATVEHVFSSDNLMRTAHSLLKPSGRFIINTPNIGYAAYRLYSLLNGNRPYGEGHHIRFWDFRFLRTCLFFNGFEVVRDHREFFSLPQEILQRAFRNRLLISNAVSKLFYLLFLFQHIPFCKGWATEELTLLCSRSDNISVPFEYTTLKEILEGRNIPEGLDRPTILKRLQEAKRRGWLKEHIYMSKLVEEYS